MTITGRPSSAKMAAIMGTTAPSYQDRSRLDRLGGGEVRSSSSRPIVFFSSPRNSARPLAATPVGEIDSRKYFNGSAPTSYAYDADNQLTGDGVTSPTYDATGNRSGSGYSVGAGNELLSDPNAAYSYDAAGQETKEAAMIEPGVFPRDVRERHAQHAAGLDHRGERKLAEPDAPRRRAGSNHRSGGDAQRIRKIEYPGVRAPLPELGRELPDPGNDAKRGAQSARTQGFIGRKLEPVGERLVPRAARKPAESDLVHHHHRTVDRLVESQARRDGPTERSQPAIAVASHPFQRLDVSSEEPQLAGGNSSRRGAKRLHQRRGERRASAQDGDDRLHARAGFRKNSRVQSVTKSISSTPMSGRMGRQSNSLARVSATGNCPALQPFAAKAGCRWIGVG